MEQRAEVSVDMVQPVRLHPIQAGRDEALHPKIKQRKHSERVACNLRVPRLNLVPKWLPRLLSIAKVRTTSGERLKSHLLSLLTCACNVAGGLVKSSLLFKVRSYYPFINDVAEVW